MAQTTGISWTDATCNFVIGCTEAGPGCAACYAATFAKRKWGIIFEPGGERRVTKSGFKDPLRWHRLRSAYRRVTKSGKPVPLWVFACSLSDFFDKEWPPDVRARAWDVIRKTHALRWQIVTKRIPNVPRMLPDDWDRFTNYSHVGIIATVVNQDEYDRDVSRLVALKQIGVRWVGLSIEPQLGPIDLSAQPEFRQLDWVIIGGESKQPGHLPRPFDLEWAMCLVGECRGAGIPAFVKQMGDAPFFAGKPQVFPGKGDDPEAWPDVLRVQQMPRIYDVVPPRKQLELL